MSKLTNTEKRVTSYLKSMSKAMPEVKRQISVYEKAVKENKIIKISFSPQFKND
jgi:hypothetical protein